MNPLPIAEWLAADLDPHADNRRRARSGGVPRFRQIYSGLRQAILEKRLPPGTRLPSTRELAGELGLSRNTLVSAFDQLIAEGYVATRTGSGTFVADLGEQAARAPRTATARSVRRDISARGHRLVAAESGAAQEIQPFVPGMDDFSVFPAKLWQRLHNRHWREGGGDLLDTGSAGGHLPLRSAIARHISLSRAVRVAPERVLISAGTQHSLQLCAQVLADAGDIAWIEEPGYWGARSALLAADLSLRPIGVDGEGLNLAQAKGIERPRLIYATPSHHYPTSVVMSLRRRRALLDFAGQSGAWVLEDDYDSEFRYSGRPLSSLQGLDTSDCVIYLGTFSKSLYPGIKLAYLVVPESLVEPFRTALYTLQRPGALMLQATLADFIDQGHFATHLRKVRAVYARRRELLVKTLRPLLGSAASLSREASGLHLHIALPEHCNDVALAALIATEGLVVRPLSRYYLGPARRRGLLVGFAYVPTHEITRHARRLGEAIRRGLRSYAA